MAREQGVVGPVAAPALRHGPGGRMFTSLAHRDFRYLAAGNMAAGLGHWAQGLGKGWLVFQITGSPLHLGLVAFAQGFPMFLTAPIGGILADRLDRKGIVWASQLAMTLMALLLALLVLMDLIRVWQIYSLAVLSGVLFGINSPPRQAMVFDLVGREDLPNAVALNSVLQNTTRVLGPALGAVFLGTVGVQGVFFLQAGSYMVAFLTLLMIRGGSASRPTDIVPFYRSLADGVSYARSDRTIAMLILIGLIAAGLGWAYTNLMPAYAGQVLGLGGSGYGWLMTASGVGALLGGFGLMGLGSFRHQGKLLLGTLLMTGLGQVVMGATDVLPAVVAMMTLLGFASAVQMALNSTLVQMAVRDQYRGRITSLSFQVWGLVPIASLAAGAVAEVVGLQPVVLFLGAVIAGLAAWILAVSAEVRRL